MNCIFCIIFRGSIYNLNFMFPKIMQNIAKHLFILFILSLGYISASAQNITLNSYSVKDGLSNSTVKDRYQKRFEPVGRLRDKELLSPAQQRSQAA